MNVRGEEREVGMGWDGGGLMMLIKITEEKIKPPLVKKQKKTPKIQA
jgi:hypothetical protein